MEEITLYDFSVLDELKLSDNYNILIARKGENGLKINLDENFLSYNGNLKESRKIFQSTMLGADFYVKLNNEPQNDLSLFEVNFKKEGNVYSVSNKKYFIIDNINDLDIKGNIKNNLEYQTMYLNSDKTLLSYEKNEEFNEECLSLSPESIQKLISSGVSSETINEIVDVYVQNGNSFRKELFSLPKKKESEVRAKEELPKKYYVEYLPHEGWEKIDGALLYYPIVEFESMPDGTYKQTSKIIQNKSNLEYAEDLIRKGNRAFIEIPKDSKLFEDLLAEGLIEEYEVINKSMDNTVLYLKDNSVKQSKMVM